MTTEISVMYGSEKVNILGSKHGYSRFHSFHLSFKQKQMLEQCALNCPNWHIYFDSNCTPRWKGFNPYNA